MFKLCSGCVESVERTGQSCGVYEDFSKTNIVSKFYMFKSKGFYTRLLGSFFTITRPYFSLLSSTLSPKSTRPITTTLLIKHSYCFSGEKL